MTTSTRRALFASFVEANRKPMRKACPRCGRIQPCPAHPARSSSTTRNPNRDLAAHQRFARAVKKRDNHQCRWPGCTATVELHAHHFKPLHAGGSNSTTNGVTLCRFHHILIDSFAT